MYRTAVSKLYKGLPAQFRLIWLNRRCSIGFHFDKPLGKWQTVTPKPASSQRCSWSWAFQTRERQLFDPPASAKMSNRWLFGNRFRPSPSHHSATDSTAKRGVSAQSPTRTKPQLALRV